MDFARSPSIYDRWIRAASWLDLLFFSSTIFQGESSDEHAARIQVSAGERREAVHRRQPPT